TEFTVRLRTRVAKMRQQDSQVGQIDIGIAVQVPIRQVRTLRGSEVRQQDRQVTEADLPISVQVAEACRQRTPHARKTCRRNAVGIEEISTYIEPRRGPAWAVAIE